MKKPGINTIRFVFYVLISAVSLFSGIYGLYLLNIKAELPFKYEQIQDYIVVKSNYGNIKEGDRLLLINGIPVNEPNQIEFILDRLTIGDNICVNISTGDKQNNENIILIPAYPDSVFIVVSSITGFAFWIIAVFLLIKKPHEKDARTLSYLLLLFAISITTSPGKFSFEPNIYEYLVRSLHFMGYTLGIACYLHFSLTFPSKRIKNKTSIIINYTFFTALGLLLSYFQIYSMLSNDIFFQDIFHILWNYLYLFLIAGMFSGLIIFIKSFIGDNTNQHRKKIQWIIWGICAGVLPYIALFVLPTLIFNKAIIREEYALIFLIIIPISFSIGLIKYQLFDIDVIFSRSLVYTIMSITLILIYAFVNLFLSSFIKGLIDETHAVTSVITSVFFALIFSPLKIKVQITVDRVFYRQKYDFGIAVKQFVDKLKNYEAVEPLSDYVIKEIDAIIPVSCIAIVSINRADESVKLLSQKNLPFTDRITYDNKCRILLNASNQIFAYADNVEQETNIDISKSDILAECGVKLVIPIGADSPELSGAIMLGNKLSGKKFTVPDIELLKTLTTNVAFIMRRMKLQEKLIAKELEKQKQDAERKKVIREMGIAKEVQQKLFPHAAPCIETVDYYGICYPADDVGGDYYDYFMLGTNKLAIAIGDVSGHGLSSALMMAGVTASIRGKAPLFDDDVKGLICDINEYLCNTSTEEKFLTLFYAIYDIERKSLRYVNAGHLPPLVYRPVNNEFFNLPEGGLMLGMIEDIGFDEGEFHLQKGDIVILFTDGIPETMNKERELWGMERLKDVIKMHYTSNSENLSGIIINEANKFAEGLPLDDDATIITFKVN